MKRLGQWRAWLGLSQRAFSLQRVFALKKESARHKTIVLSNERGAIDPMSLMLYLSIFSATVGAVAQGFSVACAGTRSDKGKVEFYAIECVKDLEKINTLLDRNLSVGLMPENKEAAARRVLKEVRPDSPLRTSDKLKGAFEAHEKARTKLESSWHTLLDTHCQDGQLNLAMMRLGNCLTEIASNAEAIRETVCRENPDIDPYACGTAIKTPELPPLP